MSVPGKGMPRMGLQSRFFAAILVLLGVVALANLAIVLLRQGALRATALAPP